MRDDLRNLRQPALNLDSLYGPGSSATATSRWRSAPSPAEQVRRVIPARRSRSRRWASEARDLPRQNKEAQLGDPRNDENLIVAQLHTAFLRFHNVAADWVAERHPDWRRKSSGCGRSA